MTTALRWFVAVLIGLATIGINAARHTYAAGTQVAGCSFATLGNDLKAGGDWHDTAMQCADAAIVAAPVARAASAGPIGRITPSGKVTEFSMSAAHGSPRNIGTVDNTAGPDGNLWFTEP